MKEAERKKYNRNLINKYPFLKPKNLWTGLELPDYDYSYSLADDIPIGWRIAFGDLIVEEINKDLIENNYLDEYEILQIKEKYGGLRWYSGPLPQNSKIQDIVYKYEMVSNNICIICGKPDVPMIPISWISPFCFDCCKKYKYCSEELYKKILEETPEKCKMSDSYTWKHFRETGDYEETIDISDIANTIRQRWENGIIKERQKFFKDYYGGNYR